MKTKPVFSVFMIMAVVATAAFGQAKTEKKIIKHITSGEEAAAPKGSCGFELTDDQQKKIDAMDMETEKALLSVRAQIEVKNAEMKQLMLADKTDPVAVEKKIEEIGALKTQIEKKRILQQIAVRGLLTPEQRIGFDMKILRQGHGMGCAFMGPEGPGFREHSAGEGPHKRIFMQRHMIGGPDAPPPPCVPSEEEIEIETK
jgi:Spy/CpxP family protein refolding chaperone